jgi:hypothetical protein
MARNGTTHSTERVAMRPHIASGTVRDVTTLSPVQTTAYEVK